MALYGKTVTKREGHWILSLKGQNLVLLNYRLCQLFTYQISLTYSYCSKQKLTSCVILIIPNFLARFVQKMSKTKIKLFSVTSVNFGFILNATTLIIQITGVFKRCLLYLAIQTSWLAVLTLIVTSNSGKIQKMIMIVHYY